ncbi:hypothetical protein Tco_0397141 [Tanacetum coccineum]
MNTCSSSNGLVSPLSNPDRIIRHNHRVDPSSLGNFEEINMAGNGEQVGPPPVVPQVPAPDLRTMEELCQPYLNGRGAPFSAGLSAAQNPTFRHRSRNCATTIYCAMDIRLARRSVSGNLLPMILCAYLAPIRDFGFKIRVHKYVSVMIPSKSVSSMSSVNTIFLAQFVEYLKLDESRPTPRYAVRLMIYCLLITGDPQPAKPMYKVNGRAALPTLRTALLSALACILSCATELSSY